MGYGVDLLDCDAALYWWSDIMTGVVAPAIDRVFEDDHLAGSGFPYAYFTGRMAIRMLIDNEPYVRHTQYKWAIDLHDKAIRALLRILNDSRYVDHWQGPHKTELIASLTIDISKLTATREFLFDEQEKADKEVFQRRLKPRKVPPWLKRKS